MRDAAEREKIDRFLRALGRRMRFPLRLYLVGGAIIVDRGLRESTVDVDYAVAADDPRTLEEFERIVPRLKDVLSINVKPASPADFLPMSPTVLEHARYVRSYGKVHVYYCDLASTVLSKIARGAERDLADVVALIEAGDVSWDEVEQAWDQMKRSPRGWLRQSPAAIEARLPAIRRRLAFPMPEAGVAVRSYVRKDGTVVRAHRRRTGLTDRT